MGIKEAPRTLNPKWFYDARGSSLFDQITRQPEYYLTRAELEILRTHGSDISRWVGPDAMVAELGAGNGEKAVLLLASLSRPAAYVPVDISPASLETAVHGIHQALPAVRVQPLCVDFHQGLRWPPDLVFSRRCLVFFGSTIGNMDPDQACAWLKRLSGALMPGDKMLVGVDLIKDADVLNQAYNDRAGITAAFNRNALVHLNREVGSNWDPDNFRHVAFFNPGCGRVEMHLEAVAAHTVVIGDHFLSLESGERIHTENSYKYRVESFCELTQKAGFHTDTVWMDSRGWFSVYGLSVL